MFMVMVIVGLFWSGFFIDMSGIKYGILIGGPLAIVPNVVLPLLYWSIKHGILIGRTAHKISRKLTMGIVLQPQSNPVQLSLNSSL